MKNWINHWNYTKREGTVEKYYKLSRCRKCGKTENVRSVAGIYFCPDCKPLELEWDTDEVEE